MNALDKPKGRVKAEGRCCRRAFGSLRMDTDGLLIADQDGTKPMCLSGDVLTPATAG